MLQSYVRVLKRRVWKVAAASAAAAFIPVQGAATATDLVLILREIRRSLLDLQKDGSHNFLLLSLATQNEIKAMSVNFSSPRLGSSAFWQPTFQCKLLKKSFVSFLFSARVLPALWRCVTQVVFLKSGWKRQKRQHF